MTRGVRAAILISGRGSNMESLLQAAASDSYPVSPVVVISNRPEAGGLARAAARGVATVTLDHRRFAGRPAFEAELDARLRAHDVELVCLAGYMRRLTPYFVRRFPHRILNVHPALLPAFPGLDVQRAALEHGVKVSGCTVHFVDDQVDHGPILAQAAVPVLEDDTPETLAARILEQEHLIYPKAVALYFERRLAFDGRRVRVLPRRV